MGKVHEYECDVHSCDASAKSSVEYSLPKGWKEVTIREGTDDKDNLLKDIDTLTICPKHTVAYVREDKNA